MIREYYALTKPGIVYGNLLTAEAGFLFAAERHINLSVMLAMIVGIGLVMASGCVFNNIIDQNIDSKMKRTMKRALVVGSITRTSALIYALVLGLLGVVSLYTFTNTLTTMLAIFGLVAYVIFYGIAKRKSELGTIVGSISGAIPPVVGYCSVSNSIDTKALLLFLVLVFWQMPHFYVIAVNCIDDYRAAKIPVLPIIKGLRATKAQIVTYIVLFTVTTLSLSILGYTGVIYAIVMSVVSLIWLWRSLNGFNIDSHKLWAKGIFRWSLIVLITQSVMLSLNSMLI